MNLSQNEFAYSILNTNRDKIKWISICRNCNPQIILIIEEEWQRLSSPYSWEELCGNQHAVYIVEQHMNDIIFKEKEKKNIDAYFFALCSNPNPIAIRILEKIVSMNVLTLESAHWSELSENPSAISILEKNINNIIWSRLCANPNPKAIHLIERYNTLCLPEKYSILSKNKNALHLVATLNCKKMKEENKEFVNELVSFVCHPSWQMKCANRLNIGVAEYHQLMIECGVF
jgi:hypothetical protein